MEEEAQASRHRHVWHLIPWVVNGTSSSADRRMVADHVSKCADCQEEMALQGRLQAAMAGEMSPMHDPGPALQQLWDRIDGEALQATPGEAPETLSSPTSWAATSFRWSRWLAAAVVVQALGLTALAGALWQQQRTERAYVTLSEAPPVRPQAQIRLVPAPSLRFGRLQALLKEAGWQVVETNADGGILGLAPGATGTARTLNEALLARLRAEPGVLLAEPIVGGAAPLVR